MIEIIDKSECCGCHACYSVCPKNAIKMIEDEKGFKIPKINKKLCINCGKCDKVCPIKNTINVENKPVAYAAYNKDEDTRLNSSSGGIFSLLAEYILNLNGVVFGAKFNENFEVVHDYITKKEDIPKLRGSKYVQSVIGNSYKDAKFFLEEGKYVLFTGTPCQIEGLLKYLNKEYDKLYTQDIICHGVPSPKVWNKYLKYRQNIDNAKIENVEFRNKKYSDWENYEVCFKYENEIYHVNHNKDSYMKAFLRDASLRDSCYACKFKSVNRASDILLADFWGINNLIPDFNDKKGLNLLIVNTTKGKNLIKNIDNLIEKRNVDVNQAIKYNRSCVESCKIPKMRETFFENINENNFEKVTEKFTVKSSKSVIKRVLRKVKKIMLKK